MATSGSFSTGTVGNFYFTFEWYRTGYNSSANEHYIHYTVYAHNTAGNYRTVYLKKLWVNGSQRLNESGGTRYYDGNIVTSGDITVGSHNSAGDGWFNASFEAGVGTTPGSNCSGEGSWDLDRIPRYANVSISANSRAINKLTYNCGVDATIDWKQYRLNGGSWINDGGSNTISNLNPNTTYSIQVRVRRADSGLWSESNTVSMTTYDIARIASLTNFEHGNNANVSITNPASISSLSLVMKIGDIEILKRTVTAGNNIIEFSDEELDNLYKQYGNSSSLTITFVLTGSGYTNSKTCAVTLKGNQKTTKINIDSNWKRGKIWINIEDTWKKGVIYKKINGLWKRGI